MFLYVLSVLSYWCLNICDLVANFNFFREFEERWNKIRSVVGTWLSKYLLAQSYQCKHKQKVWNMFKASNKDTRTTSITSFWGLTVKFEHISHLFLVFLFFHFPREVLFNSLQTQKGLELLFMWHFLQNFFNEIISFGIWHKLAKFH